MNQQIDYPALYHSSDVRSVQSQKAFFRTLYWHLFFLMIAAVISVINSPRAMIAFIQVIALIGALGCSVYLFAARPDRFWYTGRSVAESIKTISWRFVTKAEPFNRDDDSDREQFLQTLKSIVDQNREVARRWSDNLGGSQIPEEMETIRKLPVKDRLRCYIDQRIADQQSWYVAKAAFNKRKATTFFIILIATNFLALGFAIAKVRFPSAPYWPTDAFIALAASVLSWVQAKRYSELSAAYTLAAHEISIIRDQANRVKTDDDLSRFVGDAENAFSREHTQWVARKDS